MNTESNPENPAPESLSRKPRIGLLLIGHPDYPNDVGRTMQRSAGEALRNGGCDVIVHREALLSRTEAMQAGEAMAKENPDGVILFLGTWIEAPVAMAAVREFEHLPFAVWGFPEYMNREGQLDSTGSIVALTVMKATLERMGYPFTWIGGLPGDPDSVDKALRFARIAMTMRVLRRSAVGLFGYASMGMYTATFDHVSLRRHIGPEVIHFDTATLLNRMEAVSDIEKKAVLDGITEAADVEEGFPPEHREKMARMAAALASIAKEHELSAVDLKCQYELSKDAGCTGCVPLSWLADRGIVAGCEGDVLTTVTQLMLAILSRNVPTYGDLLDWDSDGNILISSCGLAPFGLCADRPVIREHTHPGFRGPLVSSILKKGTLTLARLGETAEGYRMQVLVGKTVDTELRQGRFPAIKVNVRESRDAILESMTSQHFALVYGSVRGDLRELCRWMDIEYIGR